MSVERALENARSGAQHPGKTLILSRRVAIGDPQAPLEHIFAILDAHQLLDHEGWLHPSVHLVSMGDHFDFGGAKDWKRAAADGYDFLSWLAAHPDEQVTLLFGNHDSARVGELAAFDDAGFARARDAAVAIYAGKKRKADEPEEAAFLRDFPGLPSSELAARDFSAFEARQRDLVTQLLLEGRFRLAAEFSGVLLTHAGVTHRELLTLSLRTTAAATIAGALNDFLAARVRGWKGGAIDLSPLHVHGDGAGEGGGLLYHRAAISSDDAGPRRRRFAAHELPSGLTQVIGHVRDAKTRQLLGLTAGGDRLGAIRSLTVRDTGLDYTHGVDRAAQLIFLDGGMKDCAAKDYQLLDLDALRAL
jgi:hypothetical protein